MHNGAKAAMLTAGFRVEYRLRGSGIPKPRRQLRYNGRRRRCCHSLAEIRLETTLSAEDTPVIIDSQSPAYSFAGMGLSYFGAFELPRSAAAMTLRIQSRFIQHGASPDIRHIFIPVIMFLDQRIT